MLWLLIPVNYLPIFKLSAALFYGIGQHSMRKSAGNRRFAADFANGAQLATSFHRSRFLSHLFCSYFPTPFPSLFRRYRWLANAHTSESSCLPFSSSCLDLYCVVVRIRFWNFHSGRCRTVISPHIAAGGPVNIASSVIHRRFAILSLRVVSRSRMAAREWINAATDGDGFEFVRIERT